MSRLAEIKTKEDVPRGFAGIIEKTFEPLNSKEKFKRRFETLNVNILLNAINVNYAALIEFSNGYVKVSSIPNKPKEELSKKKIGWDAYLEMDTQTFLALAMKRLSMTGLLKKIVKKEVRIKGMRKLLILPKILSILIEN